MAPQVGELIKRYREEAGISRNALARAAGIDPAGLKRIEEKGQAPRAPTVARLIRGFGWSLTDERAQGLFAASTVKARKAAPTSVLKSPLLEDRNESLLVGLRELRATLFRAVEIIADLESAICDPEDN